MQKPLQKHIGFALSVITLVGGALLLRLRVVAGRHPLLENADEIARMLHTMRVRHDQPELAAAYGAYTFNPSYDYTGFPPLQLWVHAWVQRLVEARSMFPPVPADYILAARYLSMGISVLTVLLMVWMGYELGKPLGRHGAQLAALLTGLGWAVAPNVILVTNLALADPLLYPFIPLSVIGMLYAVRGGHGVAAVGSLVCVIIAIYAKYALVYALVFPAMAAVGLIWQRGDPQARALARLRGGLPKALPWITLMALVSAMTAGWLIWGNQIFELENRETREFYQRGLVNALNLEANYINIQGVIARSLGVIPFFAVIIAGMWADITQRRRGGPSLERWPLWVLAGYFMLGMLMISSVITVVNWDRSRYTLAPMMAGMGVWGVLAAQLTLGIGKALAGYRWQRAARVGTALACVLPVVAYGVQTNHDFATRYAEEPVNVTVWRWADASIPGPEGKIMIIRGQENWQQFVWDRANAGYDGSTSFEYEVDPEPEHLTPQQYQEAGVAYLFLSEADLENDVTLRAYVADTLRLKSFAPNHRAESDTHFYRLLRPQAQTDMPFTNGITLVGYDLSVSGDAIRFRPYWQATQPVTQNLSMYVHLHPTGRPDEVLTQSDGPPAKPTRLTPTWNDPNEVIIGREAMLELPGPVADRSLRVGLYDVETGQRIPLVSGPDGLTIPLDGS